MTTDGLLIGIVDSGVNDGVIAGRRDFSGESAGPSDLLNHGSVIARVIGQAVPGARFLDARIFGGRMVTTPAIAAAGLDWVCEAGARIATLSFGLRTDRSVLRDACARAVDAGVIVLAAAPARGGPVYPAAYPGVLAITGDARLGPGEVSALMTEIADFGAYAWPSGREGGRPVQGGASFAVATAAAAVADYLSGRAHATVDDVTAHLTGLSRFKGPERRREQ